MRAQDDQLLNVGEAAEMLGLSINTLRQWVCQRRLPVIKLGRAVRLSRQDLEGYIAAHRREASPMAEKL